MDNAKLLAAVSEARRFIERAKTLDIARSGAKTPYASFPKEQGAVRRASLDLTRALADLRRPRQYP
jgi:hypothetical protein